MAIELKTRVSYSVISLKGHLCVLCVCTHTHEEDFVYNIALSAKTVTPDHCIIYRLCHSVCLPINVVKQTLLSGKSATLNMQFLDK